jgi:hypothetical protein
LRRNFLNSVRIHYYGKINPGADWRTAFNSVTW